MRNPKLILILALCFHLFLVLNAFADDLDDGIDLDEDSVSSIDTLQQGPNVIFKKQKAKTSAAINQKRQEQGLNDGRVSDGQSSSSSGNGGVNIGGVNVGAGGKTGDINIFLNLKDVDAVSTKK